MKNTKILLIIILFCIGSNSYSQYNHWLMVDSLWESKSEFNGKAVEYRFISCIDSNNCKAIALTGVGIFIDRQTSDGGKTWFTTLENTPKDFLKWKIRTPISLSYPTLKTCLIVCDSSTIFISNDSSKSWQRKEFTDSAYFCKQAQMLNDTFGVIIAGSYGSQNNKSVFITNDGAITWKKIKFLVNDSIINPFYLSSISIVNEKIFYAFAWDKSNRNILLKTTNGGVSWDVVNQFKEPEYKDIQFVKIKYFTEKMGYLGGYNQLNSSSRATDYMFKTYDGGITWIQSLKYKDDYTKYSKFRDMTFSDSLTGAILSEGSRLTYTTDGGKLWRIENNWTTLRDVLNSIGVASPNFILGGSQSYGLLWRRYANPITNIEVESEKYMSSIFPNPASDYIEISLDSPSIKRGQGGVSIEIFNIFGEKVEQTSLSVQNGQTGMSDLLKIDISNLPSGVYFVKVGDKFEKFIKW